MKKIMAFVVIVLAVASSAFTSIHSNTQTTSITYTLNGDVPNGSNEVLQSAFLACPAMQETDQICAQKWDVTDPGNPQLQETRFDEQP